MERIAPFCSNPDPHPDPLPGSCPNPNLNPSPTPGFCPNPIQTGPVAGVCPNPGPPAPTVEETPVCTINPGETTIPPGGTSTTCRPGAVVYREVQSVVSVCGDNIPGPDGTCADGISNVSTGTFQRLVPATELEIGDAYLTPYAVIVADDTSKDGLIQPGETATVTIQVLNAGPVSIADAQATLVSPPVDLTDDGISNAVGATIASPTSLGKIIHGDDHATVKVKTSGLVSEVRKRLDKIAVLLSSPAPPDLVLNRHCTECEFQARCRKIAIEKDDLSLLSAMSEKERNRHRGKGIFTVNQLSYTFRPRRTPKRGKNAAKPHLRSDN